MACLTGTLEVERRRPSARLLLDDIVVLEYGYKLDWLQARAQKNEFVSGPPGSRARAGRLPRLLQVALHGQRRSGAGRVGLDAAVVKGGDAAGGLAINGSVGCDP